MTAAVTTQGRNRNRFQVELGDQWRAYAKPEPGLIFLGTVQRGMHIGALCQDESGAYLCINGRRRQILTARKAEAAIAAAKAGQAVGLPD